MQEHPVETKNGSAQIASAELYAAYRGFIKEKERKGLDKLDERWSLEKPLSGKSVCINCHFTRSTLLPMQILLNAGAEVHVTSTPNLVAKQNIVEKIIEAAKQSNNKLRYYSEGNIPAEEIKQFDAVIDCDAGLLDLMLEYGSKCPVVELTHTNKYDKKNLNFPVINVDGSITKVIETFFGTGDGFWRSLINYYRGSSDVYEFTNVELFDLDERFNQLNSKLYAKENSNSPTYRHLIAELNELNTEAISTIYRILEKRNDVIPIIQNKKFVIFGYGKVGRGIVYNLTQEGVSKANILVIDPDDSACKIAEQDGVSALILNKDNIERIKQKIKSSDICVTATGVENCISNSFKREDFKGVNFNMGTPDEWGGEFSNKEIYNRKKPANFADEYPTQTMYLDPIFEILLIATKFACDNHEQLKKIFQKLPVEVDLPVIAKWAHNHPQHFYQVLELIPEEYRQNFIDIYNNMPQRRGSIESDSSSSDEERNLQTSAPFQKGDNSIHSFWQGTKRKHNEEEHHCSESKSKQLKQSPYTLRSQMQGKQQLIQSC